MTFCISKANNLIYTYVQWTVLYEFTKYESWKILSAPKLFMDIDKQNAGGAFGRQAPIQKPEKVEYKAKTVFVP